VDGGAITFRAVTPDDFLLLGGWLALPYVARWWNHQTSPEAVERDFGPTARGEEPAEDLLALLDGRPFGLVQRQRLVDFPDELALFAALLPVPPNAMSIDYLIGDPDLVGVGLGARMIRAVVADTWTAYPAAECVLVAVNTANTASWRVLESAGFVEVGTTDMPPDNPVDDPLHVVHRIDRPACRRCATVRDRDAGDAIAWALDREGGGLRWLCPSCVRRHARDIEAKLPGEWWG
jgi:aminoglycoside 6'-N-acetyltransferase